MSPSQAERTAARSDIAALLHSRRTTLPKRLHAPGPDAQQRSALLAAAAAAPDHGRTQPWRLVEIPDSQRGRLADAFAAALLEREPQAGPGEIGRAREKAARSPWLLLAVCRVRGGESPPAAERLLSAGCAIQNMLLLATAQGYASALTSGQALGSRALRRLFALSDDEDALCFLSFGSVSETRPAPPRPGVDAYFSRLGEGGANGAQGAEGGGSKALPGFSTPSASTEVPLEMLAACHGRVERQCETLLRLGPHLESHGCDDSAREAARAVMRYFDTAALDHHADEEQDLFPALLQAVAGSDAVGVRELTAALAADHQRIAGLWARLRLSLALIEQGRSGALDAAALRDFVAAYRAHIAREDGELLPLAARLLDDAALAGVGREMRLRRGIGSVD